MWTIEQQKAIETKGVNLLVSASAGSGKTTVMLERVVRMLEGGVRLGEMVICTYTKASAADMKAKLYKKLSERILKNEKNKARSAVSISTHDKNVTWARDAMREIPLAQISTLHSFCQTLIKDFFYFVDVSPDFKVLSENEADSMLRGAIEKAILGKNEELRVKSGDEDFTLLYEVMLKNRSHRNLVETVYQIFKKAQSMEDFEEFLNKSVMWSVESEVNDKINLTTTPDATVHASSSKTLPLVNALVALTKETKKIYALKKQKQGKIDYSDFEELVHKILEHSEAREQIAEKYKYIFIDEYQDANYSQEKIINSLVGEKFFVGDVKQSIYGFRNSNPRIFVERMESMGAGECVATEREGKNKESNSQQKTSNREHLNNGCVIELNQNFRSDREILEFCNDVFSVVMKKEFGQVDYFKEAMFSFPAMQNNCGNEDCNKIAGVGTSHANSSNFSQKMSVNDQPSFGRQGASTTDDISSKIQLHIIRKDEEKKEKDLIEKVYSVKDDEGESEKASKSEHVAESALVVSHIVELVENGAVFKDIAILLRGVNTAFVGTLKNVLGKHNIPFSSSKKRSAGESRAVQEVVNFLKAVQNPHDDVALVASMLSSFGKFSLDDLREIGKEKGDSFFEKCLKLISMHNSQVSMHNDCEREGSSSESGYIAGKTKAHPLSNHEVTMESESRFAGAGLFRPLFGAEQNTSRVFASTSDISKNNKNSGISKNKKKSNNNCVSLECCALKKFLNSLNYFQQLSRGINVPTLLGRIIAHFDFFKHVFAYEDGKNLTRELSLFLDYVAECSFKTCLEDFLLHYESAEISLETTVDVDSIQIATIHSSKGLEYEHVILPQLSQKFNMQDTHKKVLIDADYGFAIKDHCVETRKITDTPLMEFLKEKMTRERKEEEMRLLYVALTRAKKSVFMTAFNPKEDEVPPKDAMNYVEWILRAKDSKRLEMFWHGEKDCIIEEREHKTTVQSFDECQMRKERFKKNFEFEYQLDTRVLKTTVTKIAKEDGGDFFETEDVGVDNLGRLRETVDMERATAVGNAYHKIMQLLDFGKEFLSQYEKINSDLKSLVDEGKIEKAFHEMVKLTKGKKHYKEKAFVFSTKSEELKVESEESGQSVELGIKSGDFFDMTTAPTSVIQTPLSSLLVQGVIDLIVDNGEHVLIVDYKSGKPSPKMKKAYDKQLEVYKKIAEKLLGRRAETMLYFFG
ncbi:MAG: UvrD-helicase domain-containing protein [Firmicutes bacterium]|nr:UvrD-helicase domain-containing protein [Bacillota bacterium]